PRGSADRTLLFNMVGEIEDKDSLVMTYDDLFSYMEAIFERKRMPEYVKGLIQQATYFIFLGMPLDKWYFHLFMRILNQHRNKRKSKRYSASAWVNDENATFCEEQYTLTFVREGIGPFVDELVSHFQGATGVDGASKLSDFDRWRDRLKVPDPAVVAKVLEEMKPYTENDTEASNDVILLEANWSFFQNTKFETEKAESAMRSKIISDILSLISQLESSSSVET
ncbi:MAG: SIR2 family protein, partial [Lewinella sp.]|nr:SIR2 family protein [Lewinella sp.]